MKAVYIESFAPQGNIKVGQLPKPEPGEGEVSIAVEYAGVNPVDGKVAQGLLKERLPHQFPLILGWEASGSVHSLGKNATGVSIGDKIYTYCRKPTVQHGSFAQYLTVLASDIAIVPQSLSMAEAAAVPLSGLTAWQSLFEKAHLKPDEKILIHAGGGGVGSFAIQWAKFSGAYVIVTASKEKEKYVKQLGADEVIDYRNVNFVDEIRKNHPFGIEVVFDTLGKDIYTKSFEVLKQGGRLVSLLEAPNTTLAEKFQVEASYHFVYPSGQSLRAIAKLFDQGKVVPPKIQVFKLDEAILAIEEIRKGHTSGKIVLKIG